MTASLNGKVAIVTGSARGLGRAYALRLATLGADVVITDINLNGAAEYGEKLERESVMAEIEAMGRRSLGIEGDLTKPDFVTSLFDNALSHFGKVDILVSNAGWDQLRPFLHTDRAFWDKIFGLNLSILLVKLWEYC